MAFYDLVALAVVVVGFVAYRYAFRRQHYVSSAAERVSSELALSLDHVVEEPEEFLVANDTFAEESLRPVRPGQLVNFCAAVVLTLQAEWGFLEPTEANRLMVVHLATKLMVARHVRKADSTRALPIIVVGYFTPTSSQCLGQELRYAGPLDRALRRYRRRYDGRSWEEWAVSWWKEPRVALEFAK